MFSFSRRWLVASRPVDDRLEFPRWVSRGFSRDLAMVNPRLPATPTHSCNLIPFLLQCSFSVPCSLVRGARVAAFGRSAIILLMVQGRSTTFGSVWLLGCSLLAARRFRVVRAKRARVASIKYALWYRSSSTQRAAITDLLDGSPYLQMLDASC